MWKWSSLMSRLEIAEITGKNHAHVMRDIRNILSNGAGAHNFVEPYTTTSKGASESIFGLSSYQQKQPNGGYKEIAMYDLTPKGCLILASGIAVSYEDFLLSSLLLRDFAVSLQKIVLHQ